MYGIDEMKKKIEKKKVFNRDYMIKGIIKKNIIENKEVVIELKIKSK